MKANIICAWCKRWLGWKAGMNGDITHGICKHCKKELD